MIYTSKLDQKIKWLAERVMNELSGGTYQNHRVGYMKYVCDVFRDAVLIDLGGERIPTYKQVIGKMVCTCEAASDERGTAHTDDCYWMDNR